MERGEGSVCGMGTIVIVGGKGDGGERGAIRGGGSHRPVFLASRGMSDLFLSFPVKKIALSIVCSCYRDQ